MRKFSTLVFLVVVLTSGAFAATLYKIRAGYYPQVIRIVLDFDASFNYQTETLADKIIIRLPKTAAGANIPTYFEINDLVLKYLQVEKEGEDLKVTIPLPEPLGWRVFHLNDPPRLVVDFGKEFTHLVSGGTIAKGVEYLKIKQRTQKGFVFAHVLKIDPQLAEVRPALAKEPGPNILEAIVGFLNPWRKEKDRHFYQDKVSNIVAQNQGVAGINGGFFAPGGKPLGTLMIDRNLLSSPLYDRTALILTEDKKAYIDNIMIESFFRLSSGIKYKITGVNQARGKSDTVLYTRIWSERTGTNNLGMELVVENDLLKEIKLGNAEIPPQGYVLSLSGPEIQFLSEQIKIGDQIQTSVNLIPYLTQPEKIQHIVSGGPRLLKAGRLYISRYEERFRADVAKGRAARSAAAITQEGKLLLVGVEGLPQKKRERGEKSSLGMTLEELATLLLNLDAVEAVNLDGGSSSTMVIKGQAVNKTTAGFQKKVSNAIIVRSR